jgi:chromosome segregation ATPase
MSEYKKMEMKLNEVTKQNFDLLKENEELRFKQKIFTQEKEGLIREKDEQENQKLNLQMELSHTKYKIFEYDEKLKGLVSVVKTNEQQIEKDRNLVEFLYNEIENIKKAKDDVSNFYLSKIEFLEDALREANYKNQNQMKSDISYFRESIRGYNENQNNYSLNNGMGSFDHNFMNTLDMLQKDFEEERKKYNLIIQNKQEEVLQLRKEISTKNNNDIYRQKNEIERLRYELTVKDNEITLLKSKVGKLEDMWKNYNNMK